MNSSAARPVLFQFSVREMLLFVVAVGVGLTALKYTGNVWWTVLSGVALALFLGALVMAFVERGERQAIGFVLCVGVYGGLCMYGFSGNEITFHGYARLPTTVPLKPLYRAMAARTWIDPITGREIPESVIKLPPFAGTTKPIADIAYADLTNIFNGEPQSDGTRPPTVRISPHPAFFSSIGHLLWGIVIGYLGGRFGSYLYERRKWREEVERGHA